MSPLEFMDRITEWLPLNGPQNWPQQPETIGVPNGTGVPDTFRCIECTLVRPNAMKHSFQQRDTCTECLINMTSGP